MGLVPRPAAGRAVFVADAFITCLGIVSDDLIVAGCNDGAVHFLKVSPDAG
jgi:hypothetical protein